MALQLWFPFNKDTRNQGLYPNITFTHINGILSENGIANKCFTFSETSGNGVYNSNKCAEFMNRCINNHSFTLAAWVKTTANNTPVLALSYGLRFFAGAASYASISLYNSSRTVYCRSTKGVNDGKWHHIAGEYNVDTGEIRYFVDGECTATAQYTEGSTYSSSWTNGIFIGRDPNNSTANASYYFQGSLNDVRIYDNYLSDEDIATLAMGKIMEIDTKECLMEASVNLNGGIYKTGDITTFQWDKTLHEGAITVYGWSSGYNSGVPSPTIGYHAFWKMIDDVPTMVFHNKNNEFGLGKRWLGICGTNIATQLGNNGTYTISFDAKCDTVGVTVSTGLYYQKNSMSSRAFNDQLVTVKPTTEWRRYSVTKSHSDLNTNISAMVYFYGHGGAYGSLYIRNAQVELGDVATTYTSGTRREMIPDQSGMGNSFENVSTNVTSEGCKFNGGYLASSIRLMNEMSFSAWVRFDGTPNGWFVIDARNSNGQGYQPIYVNGSTVQIYTSNSSTVNFTYSGGFTVGKWYHMVSTIGPNGSTLYVNGKKIGTATNVRSTTSLSSELTIGNRYSRNYQFNGLIDNITVYATVISDEKVVSLYEKGKEKH